MSIKINLLKLIWMDDGKIFEIFIFFIFWMGKNVLFFISNHLRISFFFFFIWLFFEIKFRSSMFKRLNNNINPNNINIFHGERNFKFMPRFIEYVIWKKIKWHSSNRLVTFLYFSSYSFDMCYECVTNIRIFLEENSISENSCYFSKFTYIFSSLLLLWFGFCSFIVFLWCFHLFDTRKFPKHY